MKHAVSISVLLILLVGCTTRTFTNTKRAAIEQLLLSGAVDTAVEKFDIPHVAGRKTYLDFTNLAAYDVEYIRAAVRTRFARLGAVLVADAAHADYVVEIACGALGTEYKKSLLGIPALPMPGSPVAMPELAIYSGIEQSGIVKLLVSVYSDGRLVTAERYYGKVKRDENSLLCFQFQKRDDIRKAWEKADRRLEAKRTTQSPH